MRGSNLSDTTKTVLTVMLPVALFILLLLLAFVYRHLHPHPPPPTIKVHDLPTSPADGARKGSFTQATFTDKTYLIRKVSHLSQPDEFTSVNSVCSTLTRCDDPQSHLLPYGGRKSSIPSLYPNMTMPGFSIEGGVLEAGERRPSVLSLSGRGMDVRKINVGGEEDMIRVKGPSVPTQHQMVETCSKMSEPMASTLQPLPKKRNSRPNPLTIAHPGVSYACKDNLDDSEREECLRTGESVHGIFQAWQGFPAKTQQKEEEGDSTIISPTGCMDQAKGNREDEGLVTGEIPEAKVGYDKLSVITYLIHQKVSGQSHLS